MCYYPILALTPFRSSKFQEAHVVDRVLIQKMDNGDFTSPSNYIAWRGFDERGIPFGFFTHADLREGRVALSPDVMIVGGTGTVRYALEKMGVLMPAIDDLPEPLAFLRGRKIWVSTLGQVQSQSEQLSTPIFIKPLRDRKAFTGRLVGAFRDILATVHLPDDMPVLVSEAVNFIAEWRFFILKSEVIGAGCYKGDSRIFPDSSALDAAIAAWGSAAPSAYAIDLGVTDDRRTLLVEINDGYALGCLGLKPMQYSSFLETRWEELVLSINKQTGQDS